MKEIPAADKIRQIAGGWANQMAVRFGQPVWLVGSALKNGFPRDIDIRIVLPNEDFEARYGDPFEWSNDMWRDKWGEARQKWAEDVEKLGVEASVRMHLNIDFQIEPECLAKLWHDKKPKVRLDSVDCITAKAEGGQP